MAYIDCIKYNKNRDGQMLLMEYQDNIGTNM